MSAPSTLRAQSQRLREDAGLLRRRPWSWVVVEGADRHAYLHRMTSQVVVGLPEGQAAYACVLTPKGRVLGDPWIWNLGDRLALDQDVRAAEHALAVLERYVIADDVTFRDESETVLRVALIGPASPERLSAAGIEVPAVHGFVSTSLGDHPARVLRRDWGSVPGFELVLPRAAAGVVGPLLATDEVDPLAWDVLRIQEGIPAYGHELGLETMPLEARLEHVAVAFGKGCYPGQEPVVMAHHRGRPAHLLMQLEVDADRDPPVGAALLREGRPLGRITTIVPASVASGPRALGLVRHAAATAHAAFDLEGGGHARALAWPPARGDAS